VGAVHKTGTLVLSIPLQVIELAPGKAVHGRLLRFSGDTDDAWQHAARFPARELTAELPQAP
jgi:hypothetical protein